MQGTAQGYLVFQLTGSPVYLGYVGFAAGLPSWVLMLFGGVIADRLPRRQLLIATQLWMMFLAFILAGLTFSGRIQPWHIIVLAFLLGIANAFDAPARQSFFLEMVERKDLTNAIALNSSMFNLATAFGPAVGGLTYAWFGPAWCFMINGISFIAVLVALLLMRVNNLTVLRPPKPILHDLKEGIQFVAGHQIIRSLILNLGLVTLFGFSLMTLMPAWAVKVLDGGPTTNGLLLSSRGVGALAGALMVASLGNFRMRGRLLTFGSFLLPLALIAFSTTRWLPSSMLTLLIFGWGLMVTLNSGNALVQLQLPDELRGRVMAIYTLTFFGLMPIGALWSGWMASQIGEPLTVLINSSILVLYSTFTFFRFPFIRRLE